MQLGGMLVGVKISNALICSLLCPQYDPAQNDESLPALCDCCVAGSFRASQGFVVGAIGELDPVLINPVAYWYSTPSMSSTLRLL